MLLILVLACSRILGTFGAGESRIDIDETKLRVDSPSFPGWLKPAVLLKPLSESLIFTPDTCASAAGIGSCTSVTHCTSSGGLFGNSETCSISGKVCCTIERGKRLATCGQLIDADGFYMVNNNVTDFTGTCHTLVDVPQSVYQIRLDFLAFNLSQPVIDNEGYNRCLDDVFSINAGPGSIAYPELCGENDGQHVIIDVRDSLRISMTFKLEPYITTTRYWNIKVTYVWKDSELIAPEGCLQYYPNFKGSIRSFNNGPKNPIIDRMKYRICLKAPPAACEIIINGSGYWLTRNLNIDVTSIRQSFVRIYPEQTQTGRELIGYNEFPETYEDIEDFDYEQDYYETDDFGDVPDYDIPDTGDSILGEDFDPDLELFPESRHATSHQTPFLQNQPIPIEGSFPLVEGSTMKDLGSTLIEGIPVDSALPSDEHLISRQTIAQEPIIEYASPVLISSLPAPVPDNLAVQSVVGDLDQIQDLASQGSVVALTNPNSLGDEVSPIIPVQQDHEHIHDLSNHHNIQLDHHASSGHHNLPTHHDHATMTDYYQRLHEAHRVFKEQVRRYFQMLRTWNSNQTPGVYGSETPCIKRPPIEHTTPVPDSDNNESELSLPNVIEFIANATTRTHHDLPFFGSHNHQHHAHHQIRYCEDDEDTDNSTSATTETPVKEPLILISSLSDHEIAEPMFLNNTQPDDEKSTGPGCQPIEHNVSEICFGSLEEFKCYFTTLQEYQNEYLRNATECNELTPEYLEMSKNLNIFIDRLRLLHHKRTLAIAKRNHEIQFRKKLAMHSHHRDHIQSLLNRIDAHRNHQADEVRLGMTTDHHGDKPMNLRFKSHFSLDYSFVLCKL